MFATALADGKDGAPAQTTNDTGPAKQPAAAGNPELKAGKQSSANSSSNAQTPDSSDAQQSQPTTDNTSPAPLPGNVPSAAGDPPSPHAETFAAAVTSDSSGSTGSQTVSTSAKVDATGLPNFGISAATASAPSTGIAASATANASNTVPVAGLAVAIASRAQAGSSQFDIRMDPPELGRIEVRLGIDRDGRVTSHVTVDRADTLQLLQDQQPQLQQALDQAGLKTADNGLQFSLRDQSFANQQNDGGNSAQPNSPQLVIPDADLPTVQSAQFYNRLGLGSGVDISV
jgi:flagellar hook-length control protein FliK